MLNAIESCKSQFFNLKNVIASYNLASTGYQKAGVQYILSSVIKELQKDPARRFVLFSFICPISH